MTSETHTGFESLYGNDRLKNDLQSQISAGRLSHAYLITGPEGSGKKTLAHILSKVFVCSGEMRPCGECPSCQKAEDGIHPDITKISVQQGKESLSVKIIKDLKTDIYILPNESDKRVFIIYDAHKMTIQAQNALLKMLEEPPLHVVFILITENENMLLATIISRVVKLGMSPLSNEEAETLLIKKTGLAKDKASSIVLQSGGNIGKALKLVNVDKNNKYIGQCSEFLNLLYGKSEYDFIIFGSKFGNNKEDISLFFNTLCDILRNIAVYKLNDSLVDKYDKDIAQTINRYTVKQMLEILQIVTKTKVSIEDFYTNKSISLMNMFSKCWEVIH